MDLELYPGIGMSGKLKVTIVLTLILFISRQSFSLAQTTESIKINEFQISPSQWIELFNSGELTVDLTGWIIDDAGGTQKYTISQGTSLEPKRCISFQSGNFNWNSSTPDAVKLIAPDGITLDQYEYTTAPAENISIGRTVDGVGEFQILPSSTRDKLNATGALCLAPTPTPTILPPSPTRVITPTPTAIPTPTPVPTNRPSPTPLREYQSSTPSFQPTGTVLAAEKNQKLTPRDLPTVTPEINEVSVHNNTFLPFLLISSGTVMLTISGVWILKDLKKKNKAHS